MPARAAPLPSQAFKILPHLIIATSFKSPRGGELPKREAKDAPEVFGFLFASQKYRAIRALGEDCGVKRKEAGV